ncbi:F-box-like domain containing protein [Ceratobasidium theobromae]|uniref:F-box-like domain containing protein n=1 Tax=Ceratobasidium theobromae TaxID=1582974 RepID=A0A5N5QFP1_9AGAM|nr:F-box-like domain containing protein [Ceratobasidium theobromae]
MVQELEDATQLLESALERYTNTCLFTANIHNYNAPNEPHDIIQKSLDSINNVFSLVASYEKKLDYAKAVINQPRNSLRIVPINSLPDELIARIFYLVLDTVSRHDMNPLIPDSGALPAHAKNLLHVCSRWRRIAASSCALWRRINLVLSHPHLDELLAHAAISASFAGELPLDIYFVDRLEDYQWRVGSQSSDGDQSDRGSEEVRSLGHREAIDKRLGQLRRTILPRARSFALSFCMGPSYYTNWSDCPLLTILNYWAVNCTPGTLTQLSITTNHPESMALSHFDHASLLGSDLSPIWGYDTEIWQLETTIQHVEDLLRPVTKLRLDSVYFRWNSRAYHGLTELILTNQYAKPDGSKIIFASQLAQILRSSPRLEVFWFGMDIVEQDDAYFPPPVELSELKALVLSNPFRSRGIVLQLISPGPKLQRMGIIQANSEISTSLPSEEDLEKICARTRVTQLYLEMQYTPVKLRQLFGLFPDFQTLIMSRSCPVDDDAADPGLDGDLSAHPARDELHLVDVPLIQRDSLKIMERQFKKITLSGCSTIEPGMENRSSELAKICPVVENKDALDLADWSRGL